MAYRLDFSDARFMGVVTWYDVDEAERKWPDRKDALESSLKSASGSETYDDKPKHQLWGDARRRRVRVVERYGLENGQWMRCVFTWGGYLEPKAPSPYLDEDGKPENPIKAASLYIDRDNNRYGEVRDMIDPQDEINKRRSKGLHLITMRQFRISRGAGVDAEEVKKQLAKPDGGVMADDGDFEILDTNDMASANFQLLQEAKNEIDLLGANAALAGKNENDMSGRAILAQQQGGMVEVAQLFDRLRNLSLEVYRSIWNRIRQVWTGERWIRITDSDKNLRFVGLNQKVTVAMIAEEVAKGDQQGIQSAIKIVGPQLMQAYLQGDEQAQMVLGMFVQERGQEVVETRNAVNELDVDITIDEGMDTPTVQAEQFDVLTKMLPGMFPQGMPPEALKMLVSASSLRDKDKLLEMLEPKEGEGPPSQEQMMQAQMQAEQQAAQAQAQIEIEKAQIKAQTDIQVAQIKAQTDLTIAGAEADMDAQVAERKAEVDANIAIRKAELDANLAERKAQADANIAERKAMLDHDVKSRVAEATGENERAKQVAEKETSAKEGQQQLMETLVALLAEMNRPKTKIPVRDENGFIVAMREMYEDAA
jgi:hypothetical protein